jgi:eukaryotic-like serine/threonine-protein kinase
MDQPVPERTACMKTLTTRLLISALFLSIALAACARPAQPISPPVTVMATTSAVLISSTPIPAIMVLASETPMPPTFTPSASVPSLPTDTDTPQPSIMPSPTSALATATTMWGIVSTQTYTDGMVGLYVPAGNFLMGSTDAEVSQVEKEAGCPGCYSGEKPQHTIYLDAFWIDRADVTNAMFAQFVQTAKYKTDAEKAGSGYAYNPSTGGWSDTQGTNWQHPHGPSSNINDLDDHLVVQVSWNDAQLYCDWAGRQLPTEAQWEKAARGTDGAKHPWGNGPVAGNLLNFADNNLNVDWADKTIDDGYQFTSPVGHYAAGASPYGVLDMAGNVWQWVADWYSLDYYANSPGRNPLGPNSGGSRVLRGVGWDLRAMFVRSTGRPWYNPDFRNDYTGFRCSRSP